MRLSACTREKFEYKSKLIESQNPRRASHRASEEEGMQRRRAPRPQMRQWHKICPSRGLKVFLTIQGLPRVSRPVLMRQAWEPDKIKTPRAAPKRRNPQYQRIEARRGKATEAMTNVIIKGMMKTEWRSRDGQYLYLKHLRHRQRRQPATR